MTHPDLSTCLTLRHAKEVTDHEMVRTLASTETEEGAEIIAGYISERSRVVAWQTRDHNRVLYESDVSIGHDFSWSDSGRPRLYLFETGDRVGVLADTRRLFLSRTLANGGARRFAGWRSRIVALIPEEVGAKESKIMRVLANGDIDVTHTYNVLDAYAKYSEWVNELADEFGGSDEKLNAGIETPEVAPLSHLAASIAQAWLMREAADATLAQARHSLKFGLAGFSRLLQVAQTEPGDSVAELARSLHTDRPNLSRALKSAERDPRVKEAMAAVEQLTQ